MMDQLVQQVSQRAGISAEQAQTAVQHVVEQIKSRLPAPLAEHIDSLLRGEVTKLEGDALGLAGKFGTGPPPRTGAGA